MTEHNSPFHRQPDRDEELDLLRLIKPIREHWLRFGLIWCIMTVLGVGGVLCLTPQFRSRGALFVEQPGGESPTESSLLSMLPLLGADADIASQKALLRSTDLALEVIRHLGLNGDLQGPREYLPPQWRYWQWWMQQDRGLYDTGLSVRDSDILEPVVVAVAYTIRFEDAQRFSVMSGEQLLCHGTLDQPVKTPHGGFTLKYRGEAPLIEGLVFELTLEPAQAVMERFSESLSVQSAGSLTEGTNVLYVVFADPSPYTTVRVVRDLLDRYIQLRQSWATTVSRKTLSFVTDQIIELQAEMDQAAARLSRFQSESGLVSLDPQVQVELQTMVGFEVQLQQHRIRLRELEQLSRSLATDNPDLYLMAFIEDPLLLAMGEELAKLNGQIASSASQFRSDYPPLLQLRTTRRALVANLHTTLVNYLDRARANQEQLAQTVQRYRSQLSQLPEQARAMTDLLRSNQVFENLYLLLAQERQKAKIAQASTLSNLRIVDQPRVPIEPFSPNLPVGGSMALVGGMIIAAVMVIVPAMRVHWFTSVDQIKDQYRVPVFTVVPHRGSKADRASPKTLEENLQSPFMESIRLLRSNLLHSMAGRKNQSVMVTSAMPRDGKSLISTNLASILTRSPKVKRVLLIDADMHHPSLHGILGAPPSPGLSDYLNGEVPLQSLIRNHPHAGETQLDVVFSGPVPPCPVDLVETDLMQRLIQYAEEHYTFTILDAPPFPMVTTASLLAGKVDRVLTVCRVGSTDRAIFHRHIEELSQRTKQLGMIINDQAVSNGYYGYGSYGYGSGLNEHDTGPKATSKNRSRQIQRS